VVTLLFIFTGSNNVCIFGDQPGVVMGTKRTCAELISGIDSASLCYKYKTECCATCNSFRRLRSNVIPNCEYGDRKKGCSQTDCGGEQCCETCAVLEGRINGVYIHVCQ